MSPSNSKPLPYTLTNDTVIVVFEGKNHTVRRGAPNFLALRNAIITDAWESVPSHITPAKSIREWAKGKFTLRDDVFSYDGTELPHEVNRRIIEMAAANEDPTPLFKFYERLQKNPSFRSVRQLYGFLQHAGIPITDDGCFLAYKGVREDFKDAHTGTISNRPGVVNEMPRNQISDDPAHACHEGFHVGALEYAGGFSQRVVICKVDPEHVVCVPHDASQQKMRVCKYAVIGLHNGEILPSTTYREDQDEETDVDYAPDGETDVDYAPDGETDVDFDPGLPKVAPESKPKPKATSKGAEKKNRKKKNKVLKKMAKGFGPLAQMDTLALLNQQLDVLRQYAGKGLKIIGASKIPGGKTALVAKILAARK